MRRLRNDSGEGGFQLLEVAVAAGLMAIAVFGLAGAMTFGMHSVGQARQRSTASAVAAERLEVVRNIPYEQVALDEEPTHNPDSAHPNYYVTDETPPRYDVRRDGSEYEDLLTGGMVKHIEDPVESGSTELFVYQYVTWVDEPVVKRVTAVVTWRNPMNPSVRSDVTTSTLVSTGSVTLPEVTPEPGTGGGDGGETAGGPEGGQSSCEDGDPAPEGTMTIMSGAGAQTGYTSSTTIQVLLELTQGCGPVHAELANDDADGSFVYTDTFTWNEQDGGWEPMTVTWTIPAGDGPKTAYGRFVDGDGRVSPTVDDDVLLDQTPPTVPGNLRESSCSTSESDRSVTLTWDAASDTNLAGYRLYRSVESQDYEVVATTSQQSADDTTKKTHESVRYLVRAYDKAGNASDDSNGLTYARNSC